MDGSFDDRYLAFLGTITELRPRLHRYCSRMTGSVMDGEDVVQDVLFRAYRKLDTLPSDAPLTPWLFRIAHNGCIDFLRRRGVRIEAESEFTMPESAVAPVDPAGRALGRAVEHLVLSLPPKERACVLLKDVFDYSLEEIAELVDSTVGGVKAALHRGRGKLGALPEPSRSHRGGNDEASRLLHLYVERFNRRDWDGVRELIAADARLQVPDRYAGLLVDSPYFGRFGSWDVAWHLELGEVDGEPVVLLHRDTDPPAPVTIMRVGIVDRRIQHISDYLQCPWMLAAATSHVSPIARAAS